MASEYLSKVKLDKLVKDKDKRIKELEQVMEDMFRILSDVELTLNEAEKYYKKYIKEDTG